MNLIELIVVACLNVTDPATCIEIRQETPFVSEVECQIFAQMPLAKLMEEHPKRHVARYYCHMLQKEQST